MKMCTLCAIFLLCSCSLLASGQDIGHQLTEKYTNKVLILRAPTHRNSLRFTATGTPIGQSTDGPWTVNGPLEINKIEVASDKLRVKGTRVVLVYNAGREEFVAEREKRPDSVQVEILLDSPLKDLAQAEALLAKVFVGSGKEIASSLPDYWQRFFANQGSGKKANDAVSPTDSSEHPSASGDEHEPFVLRAGNGVHAPKPVYTPEPRYSDTAKRLGIQGVCLINAIINKEGKVVEPELIDPLGAGLDEQSIAAIEKWEFKPATRNGQPVSVRMKLEIAFHLYQ